MKAKSMGLAILAVSMAYLCGSGMYGPVAQAAVPPPGCPMFECKTVDAYWEGAKDICWGVHDKATGAWSSDGYENIFTPQSNEKKPRNQEEVSVRHWTYDTCTPWCGKDANGKWQATQYVYIPETATKGMVAVEILRKPCTSNGGKGPEVMNPTNRNVDGNSPPGWK